MPPAIKGHVVHVSRSRSLSAAGQWSVCLAVMKCSRTRSRFSYSAVNVEPAVRAGSLPPHWSAKPFPVAQWQRNLEGVPLLSHKARSVIVPEDAGWNSTCGNSWSSGNSRAVEAHACVTHSGAAATFEMCPHGATRRGLLKENEAEGRQSDGCENLRHSETAQPARHRRAYARGRRDVGRYLRGDCMTVTG